MNYAKAQTKNTPYVSVNTLIQSSPKSDFSALSTGTTIGQKKPEPETGSPLTPEPVTPIVAGSSGIKPVQLVEAQSVSLLPKDKGFEQNEADVAKAEQEPKSGQEPILLQKKSIAAASDEDTAGEQGSDAINPHRGNDRLITKGEAGIQTPVQLYKDKANHDGIDTPKPGIYKTGFIDNDDGANIHTGPAESGGKKLFNLPLPPATRVFVGGRHPDTAQWWYVNAYISNYIIRGYVQYFRINTELPEPGSKLYQLKTGDTVEKLARREFASEVRPGYDLRYYENVLLYVNRIRRRNGINGTFQDPNLFGGGSNNIQLVAGKRIWLVSPDYAKKLESLVPSGSFSGGAVAKAEQIYGHIKDIARSVTDSPKYFSEVAKEYAEVIYEHLPEIIATVAGFILAESVAVSLAASPTGLGQLAAVLIQLILVLLGVQALIESLGQAIHHAGTWLSLAWAAEGNPDKLGEASKEFLYMLVCIAIAVLSILGIKSLKISKTIKFEPPGPGKPPAIKGKESARPSWRESENDAATDYPGYKKQQSFKDGKPVSYGAKGSSRPDLYIKGHSIEVKNYNVTTPSGRENLIKNVSAQVNKRMNDLPKGTKQSIMIDVRGQNVSRETLRNIKSRIESKIKVKAEIIFKQ